MNSPTTREQIADSLREDARTASELSDRIGLPRSAVYEHLTHVAQSIEGNDLDEQFLVAPPECENCGFDGFDDLLNAPSRCPECYSETIAEPVFVIE